MIDAWALPDPPQLEQPHQLELVKRKRARRTIAGQTALFVGAIILLDGGETPCQIVALEPEPLCVPVLPQR